MTYSMTGFASARGAGLGQDWAWELRAVNGKGLDLRIRVPDQVPGLEAALRARLGKALARGSVTLSLRLARDEQAGALRVNQGQLGAALEALHEVERAAEARGMVLRESRGTDLLSLRGVLETVAPEQDGEALRALLLEDFEPVLAEFQEMRRQEGAAVAAMLVGHLDRIADLVDAAETAAAERAPRQKAAIAAAMARVQEGAPGQDPERVAQELAVLAMKADVTEEIDRLRAHVDAARDLLARDEPVGRRLDFLSQEFNREANTLCSKAQDKELTALGLDLKAVIEQMREQVQNVE